MRKYLLSAAFVAIATTAHAADPIGFLDISDAQASTSRPSIFSIFVGARHGETEGQRADTSMPEHPADRTPPSKMPSTPSTPSKPDTPTPSVPETPTKPEPEVPTKPEQPDKPGWGGDKPGKGKDKDRDGHKDKGHHGKGHDKGGHHGKGKGHDGGKSKGNGGGFGQGRR